MKIVVTGAGGKTGRLICKKTLESGHELIATVRTEESRSSLAEYLGPAASSPSCSLLVWDITCSTSEAGPLQAVRQALQGAQALVICTSAVPERKAPAPGHEGGPPVFGWKGDQNPEQVDWLGQKLQVDEALGAGVRHVVLVSSMGGTSPEHRFNKIGAPHGGILNWKRKAEQYLIASGLQYTIIHPGGLLDTPGGERQLLLGVDDALSAPSTTGGPTYNTVPREDVATLCVLAASGALGQEALNRSFDITSKPPGEGEVTQDWSKLLETLAGANCNYSLNSQM
eukprot:CAMPEP_0202903472 /NCGR_PEP_ID=MMETSP1392-20130828/24607_1 /ASSEMBLY_ACC=CAM_ASM_000868 /TAXON_ID=225041 /ORGANISM="Chlamydomonas chlamydogama, Strain SAG 11-48b" /LENGTH=283 /DNA_ID=CAMNT_0049590669 /DNA_START=36 /DNA_END=887 /DNA_ORIENTATION=+